MSHAIITPDQLDQETIHSPKDEHQNIHQTSIKPAQGFELKQTNLAIHNVSKPFFGHIVPYYRLCVEGADEKKEILQSVDIPAARLQEAIERMKTSYQSEEHLTEENFAQWGARKGYPFFTEMLEDLLAVGPDDLPHLLDVTVDNKTCEIAGLQII